MNDLKIFIERTALTVFIVLRVLVLLMCVHVILKAIPLILPFIPVIWVTMVIILVLAAIYSFIKKVITYKSITIAAINTNLYTIFD